MIVIMLITENTRIILSQSNFSVMLKVETNRCTQIYKKTGIDKETQNTFTDFSGKYEVAHK